MKKQLDTTALANELAGGSAFFPSYKKSDSTAPAQQTEETTPLLKNEQSEFTSIPVPRPVLDTPSGTPYPVPPPKRRMKQRQPFDVYEDQYETLKRIAEEERAQGLPGSMSRMVREGIDMYLKAREKREE